MCSAWANMIIGRSWGQRSSWILMAAFWPLFAWVGIDGKELSVLRLGMTAGTAVCFGVIFPLYIWASDAEHRTYRASRELPLNSNEAALLS